MLVVDDEPVLRAVVTRLLRSEGYAVMEASDGASALTVFERHTGIIPVVLMDIQMPGPDGVRVAKDLKSKNPEVSVIYMSGQIDPSTLDLGRGVVPPEALRGGAARHPRRAAPRRRPLTPRRRVVTSQRELRAGCTEG